MVSENRIKKIPKTKVHFMTGSALIPTAAPKDKQETSKYIKVANINILSLIAGYNIMKKKYQKPELGEGFDSIEYIPYYHYKDSNFIYWSKYMF